MYVNFNVDSTLYAQWVCHFNVYLSDIYFHEGSENKMITFQVSPKKKKPVSLLDQVRQSAFSVLGYKGVRVRQIQIEKSGKG